MEEKKGTRKEQNCWGGGGETRGRNNSRVHPDNPGAAPLLMALVALKISEKERGKGEAGCGRGGGSDAEGNIFSIFSLFGELFKVISSLLKIF